ncbi:unnamed protein product [Acanthoscelides obtectus]|uniref:Uncharacterized protein n=1 Tax=Acanthoscelides obtectus TaxID=200917 RepID=A0A9P0NYG9_ACAOB|nr:unnamed protein product [Acanthoscelides obtectus]CAK1663693.1 hypothetical protein AOBTE_LOCUS23802 [Acanthoscelides obtectus]
MPKLRNRNLTGLPSNVSNKNVTDHVKCLASGAISRIGNDYQNVERTPRITPTFTSDSDVDSISLELSKLGGLSSSSSLSWSDEYDSDMSKKIQEELELMNRMLQGKEEIPARYDKKEFRQWMTTFPNLSIFYSHLTPVNSTENLTSRLFEEQNDKFEDLQVMGCKSRTYLKGCDKVNSAKHIPNQSVIDLIDVRNNQRSANRSRLKDEEIRTPRSRNSFTFSSKPKSFDMDKYLKVLPIRKPSSQSLLERLMPRELSDSPPEFSSLPFIEVIHSPLKSSSKTRKQRHLQVSGRNNSRIVLPPINSQFRSVSAAPKKASKTLSALSISNITERNKRSMDCFPEDSIGVVNESTLIVK